MPVKRKKRKTTRKTAQKPPEVSRTDIIMAGAETVAPEVAEVHPEAKTEQSSTDETLKKHEFEYLSKEKMGRFIEELYVKDIPAVGCIVRYIHRDGEFKIISSGIFFIPDVAPIKGEIRRSLR